jgi:hypothetical protein
MFQEMSVARVSSTWVRDLTPMYMVNIHLTIDMFQDASEAQLVLDF